ncbi:MAG: hypothetical protein E3J82_05770 [Candidatus Thorarchaeota archaeon]|nr:MAG: hypothetical protein E3J82_05770 [Candidatus Thorarchaeota archaeon]
MTNGKEESGKRDYILKQDVLSKGVTIPEGMMLCKYSQRLVPVESFGSDGCNHCVSIHAGIHFESVKMAIVRLNDFYRSIDPLIKAASRLEQVLDSYTWAKEKAPKPPCHLRFHE